MSTDPNLPGICRPTAYGLAQMSKAVSGAPVKIAKIAFGDGLGALYDPTSGQAGLKREILRQDIAWQIANDDTSWLIHAEVKAGVTPATVREIALLDDRGRAVFLWAGLEFVPVELGAFACDFEIAFCFDSKGGVIVVDAPDHDALHLAMLDDIAQMRNFMTAHDNAQNVKKLQAQADAQAARLAELTRRHSAHDARLDLLEWGAILTDTTQMRLTTAALKGDLL